MAAEGDTKRRMVNKQTFDKDGDGDSIEMDDDFCIVDHDTIPMTVKSEKTDSVIADTRQKVIEDAKLSEHCSEEYAEMERNEKRKRERFAKEKQEMKHVAHDNPAFEDDDGFVFIADEIDANTTSQKADVSGRGGTGGGSDCKGDRIEKPQRRDSKHGSSAVATVNISTVSTTTDNDNTVEMIDLKKGTSKSAGHHDSSKNEDTPKSKQKKSSESAKSKGRKTLQRETNTEEIEVIITSSGDNSKPCPRSSTSSSENVLGNKIKMPLTRPRRTGEQGRGIRPQSRSISSLPFPTDLGLPQDAVKPPVPRSQSLRIPSTVALKKDKPRKLLRDLSFSDCDADNVRNYGSLRGGDALPRRKPPRQSEKENIEEESNEGSTVRFTPELKSHLLDLMQELVTRGKVSQVAVLEQDDCNMVVSWPKWTMSHQDEVALVKSVLYTQQPMLKVNVGDVLYTFFKHGQSKMVGRAGDNILVAEKSETCVVVGLSDDNVPGSCLYEVSALVKTLEDKGW